MCSSPNDSLIVVLLIDKKHLPTFTHINLCTKKFATTYILHKLYVIELM